VFICKLYRENKRFAKNIQHYTNIWTKTNYNHFVLLSSLKRSQVKIEERLFEEIAGGLEQKEHKVTSWADMGSESGGVGAIFRDEEKGILCAGADLRRETVCRLYPTVSM
jgi:hypothetical protein